MLRGGTRDSPVVTRDRSVCLCEKKWCLGVIPWSGDCLHFHIRCPRTPLSSWGVYVHRELLDGIVYMWWPGGVLTLKVSLMLNPLCSTKITYSVRVCDYLFNDHRCYCNVRFLRSSIHKNLHMITGNTDTLWSPSFIEQVLTEQSLCGRYYIGQYDIGVNKSLPLGHLLCSYIIRVICVPSNFHLWVEELHESFNLDPKEFGTWLQGG